MKKIKQYLVVTLILLTVFTGLTFVITTNMANAQVSGNVNYNQRNQNHFSDKIVKTPPKKNNELIIQIKGLSNVKADSYVATFSLTQVGKTATEVNQMMKDRINRVKKSVETKANNTLHVDMISFVPVYSFSVEKRVFSKKTYNEIPKGFELKKNIHIKYDNPEYLGQLITICATSEIYDLVKVDYISHDLEEKTRQLKAKSKRLLEEKLKSYQAILNIDLASSDRDLVDGIKIVYPIEMYKTYQAFSRSSLNLRKPAHIKTAAKSTTHYYQPLVNKEFDFVTNSTVVEPVIQVMYEITLRITREKKVIKKTSKEYLMLSPNGSIKKLEIEI